MSFVYNYLFGKAADQISSEPKVDQEEPKVDQDEPQKKSKVLASFKYTIPPPPLDAVELEKAKDAIKGTQFERFVQQVIIPKFSYHIEYDDYDGEDNSVASFILEIAGGYKVRIVLFEPDANHLKPSWEKLFQEDPTTMINMCSSNGDVKITADQNNTEFIVAKHGAGGDGEITVTIPNEVAIPVLKQFYEAWTERQAKFAKTE